MYGLRLAIAFASVSLAGLIYTGTASALGPPAPAVPVMVTAVNVTPAGATVATTGATPSSAGSAAVAATVGADSTSLKVGASPVAVSADLHVADVHVAVGSSPLSVSTTVALPLPVVHRAIRSNPTLANRAAAQAVAKRPTPSRGGRPAPRRTNLVLTRAARGVNRAGDRRSVGAEKTHATRRGAAADAMASEIFTRVASRLPSPAGTGLGGGFGNAFSATLAAFVFTAAPRRGRLLRPSAELARPPVVPFALERPG
jgi:hypothetical protein